ncbi:hypothetical protein MKX03_021636 [Papaver bracteatum]|nr:hypothetical protein MKX03_021636 [Papaver bracteatum]
MADSGKIMRRSPRNQLVSPSSPNPSSSACKNSSSSTSKKKIDSDEKRFRRSPRFSLTPNYDSSSAKKPSKKKLKLSHDVDLKSKKQKKNVANYSFFIGDPIPLDEATKRWPWRYHADEGRETNDRRFTSDDVDEDKVMLNVKCHYTQAEVDQCIFDIGDCAYVKGEKGGQNYIGRILEFFKTEEDEDYVRVQWFYRAEDTVIKDQASFHDKKRVFYSNLVNDNLLDCLVSKLEIAQLPPNVNLRSSRSVASCDYFYDMNYYLEYATFCNSMTDCITKSNDLAQCTDIQTVCNNSHSNLGKVDVAVLDLYSGCGGMSTGLCLGSKLSSVNLVTKWAVDTDEAACESFRLNHPETKIRNESAADYLDLLKEWEKLCKLYRIDCAEISPSSNSRTSRIKTRSNADNEISPDEFEVSELLDICYGDPNETGKCELTFKVRWKGYGSSDDTWEPSKGLSNCQDKIRDFVREGFKKKILPLPGDVDVVCGGPPCQGISGYNRFRNVDAPLDDEKNQQIIIFMDIVKFLKPKYVLMENVADILRFADGVLGRYALSRLVHMNYQARVGIIAAGCYGLPQFRLRTFLWGAHPSMKLPQFPLPTHDVIVRYGGPREFERCIVAYDEGQPRSLEKALVLQDALSDLPEVTTHETRDEMPYKEDPLTEFQKYIRSSKSEMLCSGLKDEVKIERSMLYDHCPNPLSEDDFLRVCQIPRKKGANFRDLPGVIVGSDNVAILDPKRERILLASGKPLVPDYALTLGQGKSRRPFARLWWDETVPTVITTPNCHSLAVLHPEQNRIISIRESARLQGFPDYYRFHGNVKEKYRQVGNAVAVSVSRALGYALGTAWLRLSGDEPLMMLPPKFSLSNTNQLFHSLSSPSEIEQQKTEE